MPVINVTDNLREIIRNSRQETKTSGAELAQDIHKGKAYISQLENGKISTVEINVLVEIFRNIYKNMRDDEFNEFIQNVLDNASMKMTAEDMRHEKWLAWFNYQVRQFPVEDKLINFIREKLEKLNLAPAKLVEIINRNEGLDVSDNLKKKNQIYISIIPTDNGYAVKESIKFDTVDKILSKKIIKTNYVQMQGIIWNIFRQEGLTDTDAQIQTSKVLYENNYMTLKERQEYMQKKAEEKEEHNERIDFYDLIPSNRDKEFHDLLKKIDKYFNMLRDEDVLYAIDTAKQCIKNLQCDPGIIFAILRLHFDGLSDWSRREKRQFIIDLGNFVNSKIQSHNQNSDDLSKDASSIEKPISEETTSD